MPRRLRCSAALAVALSLGAVAFGSASTAGAAVPPPPKTIDTWAFCGVNPDDPNAATAVRAMAQIAGIDATFGPCNIPTPPYTPADPSNRYVPPDVYMRLVLLNATVGMKTVVYDARLWSTDPLVRSTAIGFWTPVLADIAAWDMGDEFDPAKPEWAVLKTRWVTMHTKIEPTTGVKPFVNFLPTALDQALIDLPGIGQLLSFDQYDGDRGVSVARTFDSQATTLMCAVNTIDHNGLAPTPPSIRSAMADLIAAGCDQILVFTGFPVYDTTPFFGNFSAVDKEGIATNRATAAQEGSGHSSLVPIAPIRLLETRSGPGLGTVDSQFNSTGPLPTDSVLALGVVSRAQIPASTRAVVLNVTVTGATGPGYVTVYPCGEARPTASNLNYDVGTTRAVAVVAQIGSNGAVCVYTQTQTDMIVDLTGFYSVGASFTATSPARLLETRVGDGLTTFDGQSAGIGRVAGGSTTAVKVSGRGGVVPVVPTDATAVAVNVTAINPKAEGFVTVYPCDEPLPLASTLNFTAGAIVANAAMVKLGASGSICVFSNVETDLILDVNGYDAAQSVARFFEPTRVLDTRAGLTTADGQFAGGGLRPADSVLELPIGGRLGVPTAIRAAVLNITVTEASAPGFVTVYPCGGTRPIASTLNYGRGTTVANLAVAATTTDGKVCIYTQTATHLVVDLSGYHT
jgi:hypothetical protein